MSVLNLRPILIRLTIALSAALFWVGATSATACPAPQPDHRDSDPDEDSTAIRVRLRVSWGGGTPRKWQGSIRILDATLSQPTVLGVATDSSASIRLRNQSIDIRQLNASFFEGADFDVVGHPESEIQISLAAGDDGEPAEFLVKLSALIEQQQIMPLDEMNNRISIARVPADEIQFTIDRRHLIFDAGEQLSFEFQGRHLPWQNRESDCRLELFAARSDEAPLISRRMVLDLNESGSSRWIGQKFDVPDQEGVYDLRITIEEHQNNSLLVNQRQPAVKRSVQFVVLDNRTHRSVDSPVPLNVSSLTLSPATSRQRQLVREIDPEGLRSVMPRQLNQFSRMIGLPAQAAIGTYEIDDNSDTAAIVLPVGGWQAIPLEIADPGKQHLIEIDYPSSHKMSLGFSVLQPDETGQVPNFGFDSGLNVPDSIVDRDASENDGEETHRFAFWPNTKRVFLLIANRSRVRDGSYQRVRLLKCESPSLSDRVAAGPSSPVTIQRTRRLLKFYEQPLFCENFAANDFADVQLGQSIKDWQTFYTGIRRLVEHLKETGGGGALINVFGEGSSLMPLVATHPTPRYDSGVFSSSGSDPMRKDVVELMYRMFARDGLVLIPVVSFDHPLADIEFADNRTSSGCGVVDYRGQQRMPSDQAGLPTYNPLSRQVQQSVNSIVREIADRYRGNPSYRGLALACRPDTFTLLPGSRLAGYDPATIARFAESQPDFDDSQTVPAMLLSERYFSRWLKWRSQMMSDWYRQLAQITAADSQQARFYLTLVDIFRNEEVASLISPSLHRSADIGDAMQRLGLTSELAQHQDSRIVLMKPSRVAPIHTLASNKCEYSAERMLTFDNWFNDNGYAASIFSHRSSWARFENLEGSSFFPDQTVPIMRLQHLNPAGSWNRERFARSLLNSDSRLLVDGGLLLNTVIDDELKTFVDVYSSLPDEKFQTIPHATDQQEIHPIAVRYLNSDAGTFLYLVNGSPWPVHVTVSTDTEIRNDFVPFGRSDWLAVQADEKPRQFQVSLSPFELVAGLLPEKDIRLETFSYQLPPSARRDLNRSYYKLRSKLIASGSTTPMQGLLNPGFESPDFESGWTIGGLQSESLSLVEQGACEGTKSLQIANRSEQNVWIRSNSFPTPETGRLSVSVWLKASEERHQPPLRISVESSDRESSYYRFAEVGSLSSDREQNQLKTTWKRFAVHFDDLPQEGAGTLKVGFDMMGRGSVWIDQIQIYDRWMDENDAKAMTQMLASIGPLMQQPEKMERCRQVLNGYWPAFLREYFDEQPGEESEVVGPLDELPVRSTMRQRFRRFVSPGIFQFR